MSDELRATAERGLKLFKESPAHVQQREQCLIMSVLAKAWLLEHPADDETLVDEAWLLAVGFEQDNERGQVSLGVVTVLKWNGTGPWSFYFDGCCGPEPLTRGNVRYLCRALGIELKENSK